VKEGAGQDQGGQPAGRRQVWHFYTNATAPPDTTPPQTTIDAPSFGAVTNSSARFGSLLLRAAPSSSAGSTAALGRVPRELFASQRRTHASVGRPTRQQHRLHPASRTWTVVDNTTPPQTTIDADSFGDRDEQLGPLRLLFFEAAPEFRCRLDGGTWDLA